MARSAVAMKAGAEATSMEKTTRRRRKKALANASELRRSTGQMFVLAGRNLIKSRIEKKNRWRPISEAGSIVGRGLSVV